MSIFYANIDGRETGSVHSGSHGLSSQWRRFREVFSRRLFGGPEARFKVQFGSSKHAGVWEIDLPYRLAPGPATLRFELTNGVFIGSEPRVKVQIRTKKVKRELPKAEVKTIDGLARLYVDGAEVSPTQALFTQPDWWHQSKARFADVHVWGINIRGMGFKEDGFDYSRVEEAIERYLHVHPDAWLILNFVFDTRDQPWWIKVHPEARCRLEDGSSEGRRRARPRQVLSRSTGSCGGTRRIYARTGRAQPASACRTT